MARREGEDARVYRKRDPMGVEADRHGSEVRPWVRPIWPETVEPARGDGPIPTDDDDCMVEAVRLTADVGPQARRGGIVADDVRVHHVDAFLGLDVRVRFTAVV